MREDKLLDAMSFLDEGILEEADNVRQGKASAKQEDPLWMKWRKGIAIIAALYLVTFGVTSLLEEDKGELIYGQYFSGSAGGDVVYREDDLYLVDNAKPWMENGIYIPATYPVYKNLSYHLAGEPSGLTDEQMLGLLNETASRLGFEITKIDKKVNPRNQEAVFSYYTEIDNAIIEVEADGLITITFKDAIEVEANYSETYASLLGFEEPIITESVEGNYIVFDGKGTLVEDMLSYYFAYAEFYINEEGNLSIIRIHNELMAAQKLGDYFYITEEEAKAKLYNGEFYTNSGYGIYEKSKIADVEIVYRNSRLEEYFMPYYCFYVQVEDEGFLGGHSYARFYVPAVDMETSPKIEQ